MKIKHLLWLLILAVPMLVVGCKSDDPVAKDPTITLTAGEATETTLSFTVNTTDATGAAWMVVAADQTPSASDVLNNGTAITPNKEVKVTAEALEPGTDYIVAAAVAGNAKTDIKTVAMSTVALPEGQELTFVMESAERVAAEGEKTYSLKFYGAKKDVELALVLYAEAELAGTYTIAEGTEAGTASKEESYLLVYSTEADYSFDEGTVTVAEKEGAYTFEMSFKAGLDTINISYEGEVANLNPTEKLSLSFDKASRNAEAEQQEGEYYITLTNSEAGYSLNLVFVGEAAETLPAGEYTVGAEANSVTIAYLTGDSEEIFTAESGKVAVLVEEGAYTFDIDFAYANTVAEGYYNGEVENMKQGGDEPINPDEVVFTKAKSVSGGADHTVTFTNDDESIKLKADIYTYNPSFDYLCTGKYTVINSGYSFTAGQIDYYYSTYTLNGEAKKLNSGTIDVVLNDDYTYNITIDVKDEAGRELKASFEGTIEGMEFEKGYTFIAAMLNEVEDATAGMYSITFKTSGTDYADYLTMEFHADANSDILPAGTYAIVEHQTAGTIDADSIEFTTFSNGSPVIVGGEVVVECDSEGNYTFTMNLKEDGSMVKWLCTYEGKVQGMEAKPGATTLNFVSANGYYSDDSCETYIYLVTDNNKQLKLGLFDMNWSTTDISAGTYTLSENWAGGSIYSGWYGTDWNDGVSFESCTAIITNDGEGNYGFDVNFTLTNGEAYTGKYEGRVDGFSPAIMVESAWGLTGTINSWDAVNPITMYVVDGYHVAYGVALQSSSEIKFVKDKGWAVNRGGVATSKPNHYYTASQDGANIMVTEAGTYDIYLNEAADTYYIMSQGKLPSEAQEDAVYEIRGDFENNTWASGIAMELVNGYYFANDVVFANANNQGLVFKVLKNGSWLGSDSNTAHAIHTGIYFSAAGSNNIAIDGEVGVKYDIYVDNSTSQVWVMTDGCQPGDEIPTVSGPIDPVELTIERAWGKGYNSTNYCAKLYTPGSSDNGAGEGQSIMYINIDLYSIEAGLGYISAGEYKAGGTVQGEMDKSYTYVVTSGYKQYYLTDGTTTFVINDDNTYTITFDLTFGDTYRYTGSYTGEIEGMPISSGEQIEVTLDYADKIGSSDGEWFNLRFYNEDSSIVLFAYFYVNESYIPAGTYTPGYSAGNFAQYNTYMWVGDNQYAYTSGDIVVELADDNTYTFKFNNMDFDGISVNTSWTGKISGVGKPQESAAVALNTVNSISEGNNGYGAYYIYTLSDGTDNNKITLNISGKSSSLTHINEATYSCNSKSNLDYIGNIFTAEDVYVDGVSMGKANSNDSTMVVTKSGDVYTIDLDIKATNGTCKFVYTGTLTM